MPGERSERRQDQVWSTSIGEEVNDNSNSLDLLATAKPSPPSSSSFHEAGGTTSKAAPPQHKSLPAALPCSSRMIRLPSPPPLDRNKSRSPRLGRRGGRDLHWHEAPRASGSAAQDASAEEEREKHEPSSPVLPAASSKASSQITHQLPSSTSASKAPSSMQDILLCSQVPAVSSKAPSRSSQSAVLPKPHEFRAGDAPAMPAGRHGTVNNSSALPMHPLVPPPPPRPPPALSCSQSVAASTQRKRRARTTSRHRGPKRTSTPQGKREDFSGASPRGTIGGAPAVASAPTPPWRRSGKAAPFRDRCARVSNGSSSCEATEIGAWLRSVDLAQYEQALRKRFDDVSHARRSYLDNAREFFEENQIFAAADRAKFASALRGRSSRLGSSSDARSATVT